MSFTRVLTAEAAPAAGPYSQAIKVATTSCLVFTSGQLPAETNGAIDLSLPIGVQTERCIQNVAAILEGAGSGLDRVIKTTIFITDMANFGEVNAVYEKYFTHKPARSCVAVRELPKGAPVEIEVIGFA